MNKYTDYLELGPTPAAEDCQQLGENYDAIKAREEMKRYIELLRKKFGPEPDGAALKVKWFNHDFGVYGEVVCWFTEEKEASKEYAYKLEGNLPTTWEG